MNRQEIKDYVKKWMDGHEPDTFVKDEYGLVMYTAKYSTLNLTSFFENLLEDFIEDDEVVLPQVAVSGNGVALPNVTVTSHQFYQKGKFHGFGNIGGEHKAIIESQNGTIGVFDLTLYQITIHRGNDR